MIKKNILTISVTFIIIYLSLAPSDNFDQVPINIPYFDKIIHFFMYLILMSVIIFENRKRIRDLRHIFILALYPVLLGIIMEFLQNLLGSGRDGNLYDVFANLAGVLVAGLLWLFDSKRTRPLFR